MLVKVGVPDTLQAREGRGYLNAGSSGLNKGCFVRLGGVFATAAGPSGKAGKPGYAPAGAARWDVCGIYNTGYIIGVVDKLEFQEESSDLSLDTIVSGESVVVYKEGLFETDQYENTITTSTAAGTKLYISASAKLTTTAPANTKPVAILWQVKSTFNSDYAATGLVLFELLPNTWVTA